MIRVQFHSNSLAPNSSSCISSSSSPSDHISIGSARILFLHPKLQAPISLCSKNHNCSKPLLRSCKASLGRRNADGKDGSDDDGFLQASLLVSGPYLVLGLMGYHVISYQIQLIWALDVLIFVLLTIVFFALWSPNALNGILCSKLSLAVVIDTRFWRCIAHAKIFPNAINVN